MGLEGNMNKNVTNCRYYLLCVNSSIPTRQKSSGRDVILASKSIKSEIGICKYMQVLVGSHK